MSASVHPETGTLSRLTLQADIAADLMSANPVSLRADATIADAVALFAARGLSAAPVVDDSGRPVGVVSNTDILLYPGDKGDRVSVRDIMTPAVFAVRPDSPVSQVVREFVGLKVHHLFVADESGIVVGAISPLDVLRHLGP
jgi:CBS domain-containing protein